MIIIAKKNNDFKKKFKRFVDKIGLKRQAVESVLCAFFAVKPALSFIVLVDLHLS